MIPAISPDRTARDRVRLTARRLAIAFCPLVLLQMVVAQTTGASAAAQVSGLVDALSRMTAPETAAISPDGQLVAWTYKGEHGWELHLTTLTAGSQSGDRILSPDTARNSSRNSAGECTGGHPAWSPGGGQLAFLSNCAAGTGKPAAAKEETLWVWTRATKAMQQVSHLHGSIHSMKWSPDGKSIGFLFVENATRSAGALDAMKPWSGVVGEDGVEVQEVWAVTPANGSSARLTPKGIHVYEFDWSPDSKSLAYVGNRPPGEDNWWTAQLRVARSVGMAAAGREAGDILVDPKTVSGPLHGMQIAVPRWSPDGKQIAFIGGLMSDQGQTGGDIYLVPASGLASGTTPKDITPGRAASPAWLEWRNPHELLVSEHVGGSSHITAIDTATGKDDPSVNVSFPESLIAGADVMSVSTSKTANIALIRQSYSHAPEVWAGPLDGMKQISHLNDSLKPQWGKAESIEWTNDGFHIQGWLLYPAGYDPGKRYPLIVNVHGGPSSAVTPHWPQAAYGAIPFSALGYFVFLPNPRGSYGQGEAFTRANVKDFGYGDLRDVLAGMDVLEKRFPIDKTREGLTGWSYGGFMTMFGVTQTTRFKAAVAGAGIANWQSYYGENSIDQWMVPFFGATVYDDPKVYAKSSAIEFIKRVRTPTLVVVGDRDGECPAPQSFEFWHALREEGVATQLVIYPDEGHRFSDPAHKKDVLRRALEWFDTQMPASKP
ncbi:MAG: hypothetical protein NVSMB62_16500 [Acidobacteriaceae bacterium]